MKRITIFTPTFNRAYIIDNLYQSLLKQTSKEFEWYVIDDGSTDETEQYFNSIMSIDNPFVIRYEKKENGGKHRAINKAVQNVKSELFFIVDSDDYLLDDTVEKILKWVDTLDTSHKWAGVSGARGYTKETFIGGVNKACGYIDAKNTERKKYNLLGDKAEVYFTHVLKAYPFPEIEGENFVTEEIVWNAIACDDYYIRWYNEIIYITEYLADGLTRDNTKFVKNPKGVLAWAKGQLKAFPYDFPTQSYAIMTYYLAVKDCKNNDEIASDLGISKLFIDVLVALRKIKGLILSRKE